MAPVRYHVKSEYRQILDDLTIFGMQRQKIGNGYYLKWKDLWFWIAKFTLASREVVLGTVILSK